MKKLLIAFLALTTILSLGNFAVALGGVAMVQGEKQLVVNGDFEDGTNGWALGSNWNITDGKLVHSTGSTASTHDSSPKLTLGETFKITYKVSNQTSGSVKMYIGSTGVGITRTTNGVFSENVVCSGNTYIYIIPSTDFNGSIDDIFITEYVGETLNAEKQLLADGDMEDPQTYGAEILVDGDMEDIAVGYNSVNGAIITKDTGVFYSGTRSLKIESTGTAYAGGYKSSGSYVDGHKYKITGWARGDGTSGIAYIQKATGRVAVSTASTDWQYFEVSSLSVGTAFYLFNVSAVSSSAVYFDDVSIVEITGGTDDWNAFNSLVVKDSTNPYDGNQNIKITRTGSSGCVYQTITAGTYRVTGWAKGDGTNTPTIAITTEACAIQGYHWSGTASTEWQPIDFVADFTGTSFALYPGTTTGYSTEFDDIQITEYKGELKDGTKQILADGDMEDPQTYGSEELADGDMEAVGVASFGADNSATLSKEAGARTGGSGTQVLRVEKTDSWGAAREPSAIENTGTYLVSGWAKGDGTAYPAIGQGSVESIWIGTSSTDWQYFEEVFESSATYVRMTKGSTAGTTYAEFDDVSVVEITGGTDAWGANNALLTKETTDPYRGNQFLRVTYNGANAYAFQTPFVVGKTYRLTGKARGDGTLPPAIINYITTVWQGTSSTEWQDIDETFVASGQSNLKLRTSAAGYTDYDEIFLTQID
uniref:Putative tail protein n=3 Tax=viral metagenome TaxID=1070528 RepID=A0A6H1ZAX0_9ZZZZ